MDEALTREQTETWAAYRRMQIVLMAGLDRQLAGDSGMPQGYYAVLAQLAEQSDGRLLLAELARRCNFSQSRLSHAVARMEELGWLVREKADTARPAAYARLTSLGATVREAAAVGHDKAVRELFFDGLDDAETRLLRALVTKIGEHIVAQPKS